MSNGEEEELGPLDDEDADTINNLRKLRSYDNFDTFAGEIDAMHGLLRECSEEATAADDPVLAVVLAFMQDLGLMLLHTRWLVETLEGNLEGEDPADWWKSRQDPEETDPDDNNVSGEQ